MSFNWLEYLQLAQQLAGKATISATNESRLRSAISRAYYSAFIQARNILRDRDGINISTQNTHKFVIQEFRNSPDLVRQDIGIILRRIRQMRNLADYEDTVVDLPNLTKTSLKLATEVIAKIQSL